MIFYRSNDGATDRSVWYVRIASTLALVAYPAGASTLAFAPDNPATSLIGYGLILASLICVVSLSGSSTQRVVAEEAKLLDEYERQLRYRAMSTAYTLLSVLALCSVIYAAMAADKGAWVPSSSDEFNGLFWGVFLYAFTLPTACLAWRLDGSAEQAA